MCISFAMLLWLDLVREVKDILLPLYYMDRISYQMTFSHGFSQGDSEK